ncbi:HGGxSTG domain-containing protein [Paenibacillus contaminans]|nr:HGGxSTG domain-containing protein [Paenibacillus contaminans]
MRKTERGTKFHNDWSEEHVQKIKILENEKERAICGAKNRRGEPCAKTPLENGRCKLHGGKSTGPADQKSNTNAIKTGITATKTQSNMYQELYGYIPAEEHDPLLRSNRLLMVQKHLLMSYMYKIHQDPSLEDLDRISGAMQTLLNNDLKLNTAYEGRFQNLNKSKAEFENMSAEERLNYINTTLLTLMSESEDNFLNLFARTSKSLKEEADLKRATNTEEDDYEDFEVESSIEGVDE